MSIKHKKEKIKAVQVQDHDAQAIPGKDVFLITLIACVGFSGFAFGRLSTHSISGSATTIPDVTSLPAASLSSLNLNSADDPPTEYAESGTLVGSVNSTKYHFPWCPGAQRIKDSNKIYFENTEVAREAGYSAAANCKGLE